MAHRVVQSRAWLGSAPKNRPGRGILRRYPRYANRSLPRCIGAEDTIYSSLFYVCWILTLVGRLSAFADYCVNQLRRLALLSGRRRYTLNMPCATHWVSLNFVPYRRYGLILRHGFRSTTSVLPLPPLKAPFLVNLGWGLISGFKTPLRLVDPLRQPVPHLCAWVQILNRLANST